MTSPSTTASSINPEKAPADKPFISPKTILPEITPKALILGILLAMLLAGSNAYLGLKIGQTVSACIPAAVISMAVLRLFRRSNILENNLVQTIASAGEVIAAGVIFTLPALVLMGFWRGFPFWQTTAIAGIGGTLGVLFSVPLRRALIVDAGLTFPEGVATAEVLKAGEVDTSEVSATESSVKFLVFGGIMAAIIKFCQSGLQIVGEGVLKWVGMGGTVLGFGTGLSPVIMSAGFIVGLRISVSLFIGAVFTWLIALPIVGSIYGLPEGATLQDAALTIWLTKLRYIGVGAMIVGGFWALVSLMKPITEGIKSSIRAVQQANAGNYKILRTEYDIPMKWVGYGTVVLAIPVFFIFAYFMDVNDMPVTSTLFWFTTAFATFFSLVTGFLCSSIAGYMTGIVGSSSNPLSGVTIAAILAVSLMLLALLGTQVDFSVHTDDALSAAAIAVVIGAVTACAAAISGDNLQDLKTGHIVGATPWKQETMLIVGAIAGAVVMSPILNLLYEAYGMGGSFPREGMDPSQTLAAPQAALMSSIAKGVFLGGLPWDFVLVGAALAIGLIIVNKYLESRGSKWTFPVLAVALGLYLSFEVTVTFFLGGLLKEFVERSLRRRRAAKVLSSSDCDHLERRGMLFASGSIAGEALMGIALAVPFAFYQTTSVFDIDLGLSPSMITLLGVVVVGSFLSYFYRVSTRY